MAEEDYNMVNTKNTCSSPSRTQNPSPSSPNFTKGWLSLSDLSYPSGDRKFVSSATINETVVANNDDESLRLTLFSQPDLSDIEYSWDIEKTLTMSDVNGSARLIIPKESVDKYILKHFKQEEIRMVEEDKAGLKIDVFDNDDKSTHKVCFKRWPSTQSYVLNNNWSQDFVKRKNLQVGDTIGLLWDPYVSRLHLKVLSRKNH